MKAPFRIFVLAALVALSAGTAANAQAQHEGHQMPNAAASVSRNPACALGAQKALAIVDAASQRIETARTASSPVDLQTALSDMQTAMAAAQAQLFTCRAAVPTASVGTRPPEAMAVDHSKMNMGASPAAAPAAPGAKPADPMAGMDHSKMNTGKPAPGAKPVTPGAKPADSMAGMDHSKMNMGKSAPGAKPTTPGAKPADPMAGMDHSKMKMGKPAPGAKPPAPGAKPTDSMAGMDHSKMNMGKPAPGAKPGAAGATSVAQGAKPATRGSSAPMAGMDHSKMPMGGATPKPGDVAVAGGSEAMLPVMMAERIADPACPDNVGQASAPKAVYELKVYYFCSTGARDEFRKDPAAYLKKHPR